MDPKDQSQRTLCGENGCTSESMCNTLSRAALVAQLVKNLSAMWETWVRSLGWEDPLEEGMATQSSGEFHGL